jgi:hypothetical protein
VVAPMTTRVLDLTDEDGETSVYRALGAASACWDNLDGAGEFDSPGCLQIGQELIDHLRWLRLLPDQPTTGSGE